MIEQEVSHSDEVWKALTLDVEEQLGITAQEFVVGYEMGAYDKENPNIKYLWTLYENTL